MPEQEKNLYDFNQAQTEAEKIRKKAEDIAGGEDVGGGENIEKNDYDVAEELIEEEKFEEVLQQGKYDDAKKIINNIKEKNTRFNIAKFCQQKLEMTLYRNIRYAKKFIIFANQNNIELDFKKPQIAQAYQEGFTTDLSDGFFIDHEEFIVFFKNNNIEIDLSKPEIAKACQKGLEKALSEGRYFMDKYLTDFCKNNNIEIDLSKPEIAKAYQEGLEKAFDGRVCSDYIKMIYFAKKSNIRLDIVHACKKGLESLFDAQSKNFMHFMNEGREIIDFIKMNNIKVDISKFFQKKVELFLSDGLINNVKNVIEFVENNNMQENNNTEIDLNCQSMPKRIGKSFI